MIQRSEELCPSGVAKALVINGEGVSWAGIDLGDDLAQVLHVVVADLGSALHDHGGEDDRVHLAVRDPKGSLLAAEVLEKLVTEARVELLTESLGLQLLYRVVLVVVVIGEADLVLDLATDVEVLIAVEEACDGKVSFQ